MTARIFTGLLLAVFFISCSPTDDKLFTARKGPELGIDFQNTITATDSLNALSFEYIYNGSGVGIGDFNNDGLYDIFLGGNQVSSELYLNAGGLNFKNITQAAGVTTSKWITGVSVVDINQDGWDDIYLCAAGLTSPGKMRNLLFLNLGIKNGMPVFVERSKDFGLDDDRYSTMAAFFDYDKDGDLDMYLVNNWLEQYNRNNLRPKRVKGEAESTDRLYRNNGDDTFTNVSAEAGILIEGYGLGVNICDINEDTWPDIYVSNDFLSNDILWINQRNGTFKNMITDYIKHQTHNGMGVDIADFNNDAKADIMVVDMLPPGHFRQKTMISGQNYDHFHISVDMGYEPQYMRNTLQMNRGKTRDGKVLFSEIALMAGLAQTDWSWAPLFADFDNDGLKDLFIGNGYRKDVTNLDFIFFAMDNNPFGTPEVRKRKLNQELELVPEVRLSNSIFRNNGTLTFEDKTKAWGLGLPTFTNGAAHADLDNDGDLDLITNNIDHEVIVYENKAREQGSDRHYLRLRSADRCSFNQRIWLYAGGQVQYQEVTPYRGFQSTVMTDIHFGLGAATVADSIKIVWPDSTAATYYGVKADALFPFSRRDAKPIAPPALSDKEASLPYFLPMELAGFRHVEKSPSDMKNTRTLLHELTHTGPCLAKGDVNGDHLDDLFLGGERGIPSTLFIQQPDGAFLQKHITADTDREDGDAYLYVASVCPSAMEQPRPHQLFLNDGAGNFLRSADLPMIRTSASCVTASDFDGDGDNDLFIGGSIKPREYPTPPRSFLLRNENGKFLDVTRELNLAMEHPGMVSSAVWADLNLDERPDLILAGEWMPIRVFINEGHTFSEQTKAFGLENSYGWWNCLTTADLNKDGYIDIIAGNTGKNSFFNPTADEPVQIVAKDFDRNGSVDPVITYYNAFEKNRFILHNRMVLIDQIPSMKRRFKTFTQYATTPFDKSFTKEELAGSFNAKATTLTSVLLINEKGNSFTTVELPEVVQLSTLNDVVTADINEDGNTDLIAIGNNYAQETLFGGYDASIGTVLMGNGNLQWQELPHEKSGFIADGDARRIEVLRTAYGKLYAIGNNNNAIQFFRVESGFRKTALVKKQPRPPSSSPTSD